MAEAERVKGAGSDTVTVACKIENGMKLRLYTMVDADEQVMGGGVKRIKKAVPNPDAGEYIVRGPAIEHGQQHPFPVEGGYALTPGVPAEFWREWLKQNERAPYVRNKMIMAFDKPADTAAAARENETRKSGTDGIDPDGDKRMPGGVKKADVKAAA